MNVGRCCHGAQTHGPPTWGGVFPHSSTEMALDPTGPIFMFAYFDIRTGIPSKWIYPHYERVDLPVVLHHVHVEWGTYAKPAHAALSPGNLLTWFDSWNHLVERIIHSESHTAGTCITEASCILICAWGYDPNEYFYIMYVCCISGFTCEAAPCACSMGYVCQAGARGVSASSRACRTT